MDTLEPCLWVGGPGGLRSLPLRLCGRRSQQQQHQQSVPPGRWRPFHTLHHPRFESSLSKHGRALHQRACHPSGLCDDKLWSLHTRRAGGQRPQKSGRYLTEGKPACAEYKCNCWGWGGNAVAGKKCKEGLIKFSTSGAVDSLLSCVI